MRTTVTSRGQTVVPAKIRRDHAIKPGAQLEWIDDGETIRVVPIRPDPIGAAAGTTRGLGEKLLAERLTRLRASLAALDREGNPTLDEVREIYSRSRRTSKERRGTSTGT